MTTPTNRYTPRENATPADIAACAVLNKAVRQTEKNMLLYGQAERPTDMSEVPDRYYTSRTATCDVCSWQWRQTINPKTSAHEPVACPACERNARMADLNRVCNVNSDMKKCPTP